MDKGFNRRLDAVGFSMVVYYISANNLYIGEVISNLGIRRLLGVQGMGLYCDRPYVEHTKKVIRSAQRNDVFIIGGGGLLTHYFIPFWNEIYRNRKHLQYILWGIGFCDHKRSGFKRFLWQEFLWQELLAKKIFLKKWKAIVRNSMISSFRDENTYRCFRGTNNTFKVGCPSVNFVLDHKKDFPKRLLIHSCNYHLLNRKEVDAMQKITDVLANKLDLKKVYTNRKIKGLPELYKWLDLYSSAKITVSSSLHGCILALSLGSKLIAVSRDWKMEGFLQMVDLEEAICDIDEIGKKAQHLGLQKDVSNKIEKIKKENAYFAQEVKKLIM